MGTHLRTRIAATVLPISLVIVGLHGLSPASAARAPLQVTLGSTQEVVYEGSRLGLITRNAPARATVTYEIWSGSAWRFGGTTKASSSGGALWWTNVPMGASSLKVRVRAGKTVSRPLTVSVKAADGWQYWDQTHLGSGGLLKRLVTPGGSAITSNYIYPLSGSYELLDGWGERVLVSRPNGSLQAIYAWDPQMREAQYVMSISTFDDYATFGRTPDEILVRSLTYVGTGTARSQFEDVTAYNLAGQKTELLARFPQDPYGNLSYIDVTSHVVDRGTGRLYFTRYWEYDPRRPEKAVDYAVTVLRPDGPPINTALTSDQMLTDGTWTQRYGVVHRIPTTVDLVKDVQARSGTGGYIIKNTNYAGGYACTFALGAAAEAPATCVRVNSGEFIAGFTLQNAGLGFVVEYVDRPRDFIVRRMDFSGRVDAGMEGRATEIVFAGK